jgi:magnesium-dependent phosphatase 1
LLQTKKAPPTAVFTLHAKQHATAAAAAAASTKHSTAARETDRYVQEMAHHQSHDSLLDTILTLPVLPRIIVFDLDNTLWTPELYQIRQRDVPRVNQDIRLFPDAVRVLEWWLDHQSILGSEGTTTRQQQQQRQLPVLGIASRTSKTAWAHHLLDAFTVKDRPMRSAFGYVHIQTGSKTTHFARIREESGGVPYHEMLFVDDDVRMNLEEVSQALGVLCCHTPRGITVEHLVRSLQRYSDMKVSFSGDGGDSNNSNRNNDKALWMGHVLNAHSLGIVESDALAACGGGARGAGGGRGGEDRWGRVKFYSVSKRFGFVVDEETGHEFFVHESKIPAGLSLRTGDKIRFLAMADLSGRPSAIIQGPWAPTSSAGKSRRSSNENHRRRTNSTSSSSHRVPYASLSTTGAGAASSRSGPINVAATAVAAATDTVSMPCFSMSQPFAALLLNGLKSVESRNNPMLGDLPSGTRVLIHCGRRDWHDGESYKRLLPSSLEQHAGAKEEDPSRLRPGFFRGAIVGMVTIGRTWRPSAEERSSPDLPRRVLAPEDGIGTYCTEVSDAAWLNHPHKVRGSPGVFAVDIPRDCLPR